ncbi:cyclic di-AMP binding protein CbpA [Fictibacillus iocasae]|uniref:Cyclic di-AMP binding protein CbpA n=1 Tax=Fictibacillus iocasae TaxID=2715437 RepID=A0ABW2NV82_9BACL
MKIKSNFIPKAKVNYVTSSMPISEARQALIQSGYRCIPVLDDNEQRFEGLIYKETISDYIIEEKGSLNDAVLTLAKDKEASVSEEASFHKVLFSIRRLPFLAVTDEKGNFSGIVTHAKVMDILEDSYGLKVGGYSITVSTTEGKGSLMKLFSAISDEYNIEGVFTQDTGRQFLRRIVITFNRTVTLQQIEELVPKIEGNGFKVAEIEDLRSLASVK